MLAVKNKELQKKKYESFLEKIFCDLLQIWQVKLRESMLM